MTLTLSSQLFFKRKKILMLKMFSLRNYFIVWCVRMFKEFILYLELCNFYLFVLKVCKLGVFFKVLNFRYGFIELILVFVVVVRRRKCQVFRIVTSMACFTTTACRLGRVVVIHCRLLFCFVGQESSNKINIGPIT